jgi:hypothetical protein
MMKRGITIGEADRRALQVHRIIHEIEQLPLVYLRINPENIRQPFVLGDKSDPSVFREFSVSDLLRLDLSRAKANGGTWSALFDLLRPPSPRLPRREFDAAADAFLLGKDE